MSKAIIGDSPKRREDARFVTGHGAYLDDLRFDGVVHAVVLRSPHAHAWIHAVDVAAARRAPGVLAVLTAADAAADKLGPLRPYAEANVQTGEPFAFAPQPLLAGNKARFAGEPVALVVAETHAQALDAAELIAVDYEPLPAITSGDAALKPGAPLISDEVPGNLCIDWHTGDAAGADAAFAKAAHAVSLQLDNHRIAINPMEPRGCVGQFDPASSAIRPTSPARTSTSTATMSPARWAQNPRTCASSPPMSAAASAPRISPTPNMPWSCGQPDASAGR